MANDNNTITELQFEPEPHVVRDAFINGALKFGAAGALAGVVVASISAPLFSLASLGYAAIAAVSAALAGGAAQALHTHGQIEGAAQMIDESNYALAMSTLDEPEPEPEPEHAQTLEQAPEAHIRTQPVHAEKILAERAVLAGTAAQR